MHEHHIARTLTSEEQHRRMLQTPVPKLVLSLAAPTVASQLISIISTTADTIALQHHGTRGIKNSVAADKSGRRGSRLRLADSGARGTRGAGHRRRIIIFIVWCGCWLWCRLWRRSGSGFEAVSGFLFGQEQQRCGICVFRQGQGKLFACCGIVEKPIAAALCKIQLPTVCYITIAVAVDLAGSHGKSAVVHNAACVAVHL